MSAAGVDAHRNSGFAQYFIEDPDTARIMKKLFRGAATIGAFFLLTGCAGGSVTNKRVISTPGRPYDKVYQLLIDGRFPEYWVTVPEREWDRCRMFSRYPDCTD